MRLLSFGQECPFFNGNREKWGCGKVEWCLHNIGCMIDMARKDEKGNLGVWLYDDDYENNKDFIHEVRNNCQQVWIEKPL